MGHYTYPNSNKLLKQRLEVFKYRLKNWRLIFVIYCPHLCKSDFEWSYINSVILWGKQIIPENFFGKTGFSYFVRFYKPARRKYWELFKYWYHILSFRIYPNRQLLFHDIYIYIYYFIYIYIYIYIYICVCVCVRAYASIIFYIKKKN